MREDHSELIQELSEIADVLDDLDSGAAMAATVKRAIAEIQSMARHIGTIETDIEQRVAALERAVKP